MGNNSGKTVIKKKTVPKTNVPYTKITKSSSISSLTSEIGCSNVVNVVNDQNKNTDNKKNDNKFNETMDVVHITTKQPNLFGPKRKEKKEQQLDIVIDHDQFVRLFMDPRTELKTSNLSYLIGYKMVYVVDAYRNRIPNVIAIVTLKINANNNAIFQSERSHAKKDHYSMIELSKKLDMNEAYDREQQAESLRHYGGNMIAWEHSTKYCAHNVETLALTFCGKFKDVIKACRMYDENMAFAESAYTHEENQKPVIYEVGKVNYSELEVPSVSSGSCLNFFHFFLRPQYAIDYGFWQFQLSNGRSDVNKSEIVIGKQFSKIRKVNYSECYKAGTERNRKGAELAENAGTGKYTSTQVLENIKNQELAEQKIDQKVEDVIAELNKELEEINDDKIKSNTENLSTTDRIKMSFDRASLITNQTLANQTSFTTNQTPFDNSNNTPFDNSNNTPFDNSNNTPFDNNNNTPFDNSHNTPFDGSNNTTLNGEMKLHGDGLGTWCPKTTSCWDESDTKAGLDFSWNFDNNHDSKNLSMNDNSIELISFDQSMSLPLPNKVEDKKNDIEREIEAGSKIDVNSKYNDELNNSITNVKYNSFLKTIDENESYDMVHDTINEGFMSVSESMALPHYGIYSNTASGSDHDMIEEGSVPTEDTNTTVNGYVYSDETISEVTTKEKNDDETYLDDKTGLRFRKSELNDSNEMN